jgi:hypothetical protein
MGKAIKKAAWVALALLLGTAMARGLPHHAAAPAAPAAPGFGSWLADSLLPLCGFLALAGTALGLYHHRKMRALLLSVATLDGWQKARRAELGHLYKCPACRCLVELKDIKHHQEKSGCAAYEAWMIEQEQTTDGVSYRTAVAPWVVRASASVPSEHSIAAGGFDTFNEGEG